MGSHLQVSARSWRHRRIFCDFFGAQVVQFAMRAGSAAETHGNLRADTAEVREYPILVPGTRREWTEDDSRLAS